MKHRWSFLPVLAALVALPACAPVPRPHVMSEVEAVQKGAAAREAKDLAPTAHAHAEKLQREARAAFDAGDIAGAQLLSERALAAYAHALALARIARAEAGEKDAAAALRASQTELSSLDGEQARVAAEAEALEMRIRVARDAQPVVASGPAHLDREKARVAASRALGLEARMLCTAARMLLASLPAEDPTAPAFVPSRASLSTQLDEAQTSVGKLDAALATKDPAPIDLASRARAACLSVLTGVRRTQTPTARAPGVGDALLAEIAERHTLAPSRDDRGVVVTLRDVWSGDKLAPPAAERLAELGRIAAAHPRFPVTVIVHHDKEPPAKEQLTWRTRADAIVAALKAAGAARVDALVAGTAAPVVDPAGAQRARNARVEIVFVVPETF